MFHNVGMSPRKFCLTEPEANELQSAYLHAQEPDTKTRYQAVRLYGSGYRVVQICDICGCSSRSLLNWTRAYQLRGITALLDHRLGGNCAKLNPEQIETIHNQ